MCQYNGPNGTKMESGMFKKPVYPALFVLINLGFLLTAYEGQTQGVINLPQTGQTKCYDSPGNEISCSGTRQDGEIRAGVEWPDPRFTVSGDCVTDNFTGLMWAKKANLPDRKKTWQKALDYVASINNETGLCGYNDWRLPKVNELESLVNGGEVNSAAWLIGQGFVNVQSDYYWSSSTTDAYYAANAWIAFMRDGSVYGHYNKSTYGYVWPVRSGQGPFVPGAATLVSPSGTITTTTPTYTWNAVSNSTWYQLWVNDSTGNKIKDWYTASETGCGSGTGTCSVTPSKALANGSGPVVDPDLESSGLWSLELRHEL